MKKLAFIVLALTLGSTPALFADDTDIYGVSQISVKPNVLIVFDRSGSMDDRDVPGATYDSGEDYSEYGTYTRNAVYERKSRREERCGRRGCRWVIVRYWEKIADSLDEIACYDPIGFNLETFGSSSEGELTPSFDCQSGSTPYRTGNYFNFLESDLGDNLRRIDVAKDVIKDLINEKYEEVNLGLMYFPWKDVPAKGGSPYTETDGGHLISVIGATQNDLITTVDSFTPDGWTPMAETMVDAGNYFAGQQFWFSNQNLDSPIDIRCRQNYIILMTDGEPTQDRHFYLNNDSEGKTYLTGFFDEKIGDQEPDNMEDEYPANRDWGEINNIRGSSLDTSDYVDDVAKILYDTDLSTLGSVGDFEKQNVITYTIGFKTDQELLSDTASNGGGDYYTSNNASDLREAFDSIFAAIAETNEVFVAPVVPVSRENRTFAGDRLYIGFFQPKNDGLWWGNIKKFGLDDDGDIMDAYGQPATDRDTGVILETSQSYWSTTADGSVVGEGGLGAVLNIRTAARNIYTYTGGFGGTSTQLSHADNALSSANPLITNTVLDVATDAEKTEIFNFFQNGHQDSAGNTWKMGDVIHGRPTLVNYDNNDDGVFDIDDGDASVIFSGNNWGTLGAFDDETGSELWAFAPPDLLSNLKRLTDNNNAHDYFVDATPKIYYGASATTLFVGERRGGYYYHALDISDYDVPSWSYSIGPNFLSSNPASAARLGQSWVTPQVANIATSRNATSGDVTVEEVFILSGGYDINQDLPLETRVPEPEGTTFRQPTDSAGRAVFAINAESGTPSSLNVNGDNLSSMTHSIIDFTVLDHDEDNIASRIYAGDMGGGMFAIRDDIDDDPDTDDVYEGGQVDGTWTAAKLFDASADGIQRKIFYAPDAVKDYGGGEIIYFGTGDRADPRGSSQLAETGRDPAGVIVENRFYAIKNTWQYPAVYDSADSNYPQPLTEYDLYDATMNLIQDGSTEEIRDTAQTDLDDAKGFYIRLENLGEKMVSSPLVFGGVIYFTTYEPDHELETPTDPVSGDADQCAGTLDKGIARLYAIDFLTGGAVMNLDTTNDGTETVLSRTDRSVIVGTSIPSQPTIALFRTGPKLYVGVEGGVIAMDPPPLPELEFYYWRQFY